MARLVLWESGKIWLGRNVRLLRAAAVGACLAAALPALVACSSDELENDGSIRGTLMVYVATMDDGTSRNEYRILIGGVESDEHNLVFSNPPDVTSGRQIKVWGEMSGAEIIVSRFEITDEESSDGLGTSQEAIIGGTPYPSRSFAYILVDFGQGITRRSGNQAVPYTEAEAQLDVFGTGATDLSVKQWFLENSYGRQDVSGGVVYGLDYSAGSGCPSSAVRDSLKAQVDQRLGTPPQHYLWYFGTNVSGCSWSGLGEVGQPDRPANDTWYNASSSCVVLVQEPAHNFGMQHSSSLDCGSASFVNDPADCTHSEYGDAHDPMGGGCRHTNVWQKAYHGWFGGCNRVRVGTSGTFNLLPLETACNGIQVLQIPFPTSGLPQGGRIIPRSGGGGSASEDLVEYYYLELRTRTGFDESQTSYPTVLVHVGPNYRSRTERGLHTWILDMNPSTNGFDGMGAGATFNDPAGGVSFTVQSVSATGAVINVTVPTSSGNTCTDMGTLATPSGPTTCGAGGMAGAGGAGGMGGAPPGGSGGMGGAGMGGMVAGAAGSGGVAGAAGMAGSGGIAAGAGGAAGFAGGGSGGTPVAGSAGAPVAGAGVSGTAGAPIAGAAGAPVGGASAGSGLPVAGSELESGCGCRIHKAPQRNESTLLFGLVGLFLGGLLRRRHGRAA